MRCITPSGPKKTHLGQQKLMYFGPDTSTFVDLNVSHKNRTGGSIIFSSLEDLSTAK